jgi:hypothetical protein
MLDKHSGGINMVDRQQKHKQLYQGCISWLIMVIKFKLLHHFLILDLHKVKYLKDFMLIRDYPISKSR